MAELPPVADLQRPGQLAQKLMQFIRQFWGVISRAAKEPSKQGRNGGEMDEGEGKIGRLELDGEGGRNRVVEEGPSWVMEEAGEEEVAEG